MNHSHPERKLWFFLPAAPGHLGYGRARAARRLLTFLHRPLQKEGYPCGSETCPWICRTQGHSHGQRVLLPSAETRPLAAAGGTQLRGPSLPLSTDTSDPIIRPCRHKQLPPISVGAALASQDRTSKHCLEFKLLEWRMNNTLSYYLHGELHGALWTLTKLHAKSWLLWKDRKVCHRLKRRRRAPSSLHPKDLTLTADSRKPLGEGA